MTGRPRMKTTISPPGTPPMPLSRLASFFLLTLIPALPAADWPRFRGPDGLGVTSDRGLPVSWGPNENVIWKVEPGAGTSSPVIFGSKIYLTAYSGYGVPG